MDILQFYTIKTCTKGRPSSRSSMPLSNCLISYQSYIDTTLETIPKLYWKLSLTLACSRLRESTNTKKTKKEREPCSHHDLSFSCAFHLHFIPTLLQHTLTYEIWTDEVYTPSFYQAFCRQECHIKPQKSNWSKNYESASSMTVDKASPCQMCDGKLQARNAACGWARRQVQVHPLNTYVSSQRPS